MKEQFMQEREEQNQNTNQLNNQMTKKNNAGKITKTTRDSG